MNSLWSHRKLRRWRDEAVLNYLVTLLHCKLKLYAPIHRCKLALYMDKQFSYYMKIRGFIQSNLLKLCQFQRWRISLLGDSASRHTFLNVLIQLSTWIDLVQRKQIGNSKSEMFGKSYIFLHLQCLFPMHRNPNLSSTSQKLVMVCLRI